MLFCSVQDMLGQNSKKMKWEKTGVKALNTKEDEHQSKVFIWGTSSDHLKWVPVNNKSNVRIIGQAIWSSYKESWFTLKLTCSYGCHLQGMLPSWRRQRRGTWLVCRNWPPQKTSTVETHRAVTLHLFIWLVSQHLQLLVCRGDTGEENNI